MVASMRPRRRESPDRGDDRHRSTEKLGTAYSAARRRGAVRKRQGWANNISRRLPVSTAEEVLCNTSDDRSLITHPRWRERVSG